MLEGDMMHFNDRETLEIKLGLIFFIYCLCGVSFKKSINASHVKKIKNKSLYVLYLLR